MVVFAWARNSATPGRCTKITGNTFGDSPVTGNRTEVHRTPEASSPDTGRAMPGNRTHVHRTPEVVSPEALVPSPEPEKKSAANPSDDDSAPLPSSLPHKGYQGWVCGSHSELYAASPLFTESVGLSHGQGPKMSKHFFALRGSECGALQWIEDFCGLGSVLQTTS